MTNYRQDESRRHSTIQNLLDMFQLSNIPTLPLDSEDDVEGDVDEPPEESLVSRGVHPAAAGQESSAYTKSQCCPTLDRRVSLLSRALVTELGTPEASAPTSPVPVALSRASTFSNASMPSTAELTSDLGDTSPARSATPSPPLPSTPYHQLHTSPETPVPSIKPFLPAGEKPQCKQSEIEANLGRKRHITFACGNAPVEREAPPPAEEGKLEPAQPLKRKSVLTFACPARPAQIYDQVRKQLETPRDATSSPSRNVPPPSVWPNVEIAYRAQPKKASAPDSPVSPRQTVPEALDISLSRKLATGNERQDSWVHEPIDSGPKLTLSDCMRKENAIRKIGEEAEEEAIEEEDEEDEQGGMEDDDEDGDNEDDFAPSDDGNESDNEAGFAESDPDSDGDSDDEFWAPSQTTVATSIEHLTPGRRPTTQRRSESSPSSLHELKLHRQTTTGSIAIKQPKHRYLPKAQHLRPSTPDLPDSTDFVCGTLDEDRPLEAAYMSCLERKKRDKHIPIPQDIDPSFPTTDPEDMDEDDDEDLGDAPEDHLWLKDQLDGFDDDPNRKRSSKHGRKPSTRRSPLRSRFSPPPPPQRRLFGHSPKRLQSPPRQPRLRSPPGTGRLSPANMSPMTCQSRGLMISRLAQRPRTTRTSSLPQTPNPFFYHYRTRLQQGGRNVLDERVANHERHVRGPVDIVIGLEKKRQKRKEKFWRQNCRKAAKEHAERKNIIPGRGAERMRELGLECAERNRGYGLGPHRPLVLSL